MHEYGPFGHQVHRFAPFHALSPNHLKGLGFCQTTFLSTLLGSWPVPVIRIRHGVYTSTSTNSIKHQLNYYRMTDMLTRCNMFSMMDWYSFGKSQGHILISANDELVPRADKAIGQYVEPHGQARGTSRSTPQVPAPASYHGRAGGRKDDILPTRSSTLTGGTPARAGA